MAVARRPTPEEAEALLEDLLERWRIRDSRYPRSRFGLVDEAREALVLANRRTEAEALPDAVRDRALRELERMRAQPGLPTMYRRVS